jgi:hypothetical protein
MVLKLEITPLAPIHSRAVDKPRAGEMESLAVALAQLVESLPVRLSLLSVFGWVDEGGGGMIIRVRTHHIAHC